MDAYIPSPSSSGNTFRSILMVIDVIDLCLVFYFIGFGRTVAYAARILKFKDFGYRLCFYTGLLSIAVSVVIAIIIPSMCMSFMCVYFTHEMYMFRNVLLAVQGIGFMILLLFSNSFFITHFFKIPFNQAFRVSSLAMVFNIIICLIGAGIFTVIGFFLLVTSPY